MGSETKSERYQKALSRLQKKEVQANSNPRLAPYVRKWNENDSSKLVERGTWYFRGSMVDAHVVINKRSWKTALGAVVGFFRWRGKNKG